MTPAAQDLAQKLAAHPGLRWVPGIRLLLDGWPYRLYMGSRGVLCAQGEGDGGGYIAGFDAAPFHARSLLADLDDPATVGCVEAQVRALAPGCRFVLYESGGMWILQLQSIECVVLWATGLTTRGEAWAAAFLEVSK